MTDTQKQLYLEIKNKIESGNFSEACELCEEYVMSYPAGIEGWLSYILAFCEVKSTKALVKCEVDFSQTEIFEKALENLEEDDRAKLISLSETISSARNKKEQGSAGYKEGLQYFVTTIKGIKQNLEDVKADYKKSIDEDENNFKATRKSIKFFSNNLFALFLTVALIMFPFLILYLYFDFANMQQILKTITLAVGGVVVLITVITKYKKQKRASKELMQQAEDVIMNEQGIISLKNEMTELKNKYKKLMKIYKFYKKRPRLSERGVAKLRTKFDNVYNGLQ